MTEFAWNRDFLLVVFINPCQQIVRQMPDHLPKVNAFRNSADTDGLGDFSVGDSRVSLRKLLYASGGPAVQRIWAWSQPDDAGDGFF